MNELVNKQSRKRSEYSFYTKICAECGTHKMLTDPGQHAYRIHGNWYCSYTCYMKAWRRLNPKLVKIQQETLKRIKNYNEGRKKGDKL